jgi:hypothetical protein
MFASGVCVVTGGDAAKPSPGASGMINAQPESLSRPSIVTRSPFTRPTTFIKFEADMTSRRSGNTAYLGVSNDTLCELLHTCEYTYVCLTLLIVNTGGTVLFFAVLGSR